MSLTDKLKELAALPDDWDSYGAPAPNARAIEMAEKMLGMLSDEDLYPDRVVPDCMGGVALYWLRGSLADGSSSERAHIECPNEGDAVGVLYDRKSFDVQCCELPDAAAWERWVLALRAFLSPT